jgi:hypothetical protein
VVEMLANYQFFEVDGERRTGYMRLLQFDVDDAEMAVNTYSPTLDDHNAYEYDTVDTRNYIDSADEFTVAVDLDTRVNALATDAISLESRTDRVIGSDDVDSGDQATTTWEDLAGDTTYYWYATASDDFGGEASSDVFSFTTTPGDGDDGDGDGDGDDDDGDGDGDFPWDRPGWPFGEDGPPWDRPGWPFGDDGPGDRPGWPFGEDGPPWDRPGWPFGDDSAPPSPVPTG